MFVQVFPLDIMEKLKQAFWPTQHILSPHLFMEGGGQKSQIH